MTFPDAIENIGAYTLSGGLNYPTSEDAIGIAVSGDFTGKELYGAIPATDSEGVFGHAELDPSNCPGVDMGDRSIIYHAIELANSIDGDR